MFNLPLPTDNLYKFIAIAGIVLVGGSMYLISNNCENTDTQRELLLRRLSDTIADLEEVSAYARYFPRIKAPATLEETKAEFQSWEYYEHWRKQLACYHAYYRQFEYLPTLDDKGLLSTDKNVRRAFQSTKGLTDADYDKWVASLSMEELKRFVQPIKDLARKANKNLDLLEQDMRHFYVTLRQKNDWDTLAGWGLKIGILLTLSGFALWYYKLQRHQDAWLLKEVRKQT